jgi:hypothetical protein
MCEIPNNVIEIDAFAALFDGFSIGSNDLTQLTLGVDRDSEIVAFDFDERDPGMQRAPRTLGCADPHATPMRGIHRGGSSRHDFRAFRRHGSLMQVKALDIAGRYSASNRPRDA